MGKTKSKNIEILKGKIPKKRNLLHIEHQINYKGAGFYEDKKKRIFRKRKHKSQNI